MGTPQGLQEISRPESGIEAEAGQRSRSGRAMEDTGVPQRPQRRRFSAEYKLSILEAVDRCSEPGEIGALLRREGIYSSLLSKWREQRRLGALGALTD